VRNSFMTIYSRLSNCCTSNSTDKWLFRVNVYFLFKSILTRLWSTSSINLRHHFSAVACSEMKCDLFEIFMTSFGIAVGYPNVQSIAFRWLTFASPVQPEWPTWTSHLSTFPLYCTFPGRNNDEEACTASVLPPLRAHKTVYNWRTRGKSNPEKNRESWQHCLKENAHIGMLDARLTT